jgi:O-antigen/teichoic acid export membrane protein
MIPRALRLPVVRAGAPLFAATLFFQLANFVFNAAGARLLGPVSYGSLAATVGLTYLLNPLTSTIQTVASRETTAYITGRRSADLHAAMWFYGRRIEIVAILGCLAIVAASPWISSFLKIGTPVPVMILGAVYPLSCITLLLRGIFQGSQRFGRLAISTAVEGVAKILAAVAILSFFLRSATGGVLAMIISSTTALVVSALMTRHLPRAVVPHVPRAHPGKYALVTVTTFALLAILLSVDTLAAKHYLSPATAGLYAGVSICGKIVYFVTSVVAIYLFPMFSAQHDRGHDGRRQLALSLTVVAGGALVFAGLFALVPRVVVMPLLGGKYAAADQFVGLSGVVFGLYGCINLVATYLLAQRRIAVIAVLGVAVAVLFALLYVSHSSIMDLLRALLLTFGCTTAALVVWVMLPGFGAPRSVLVNADRSGESITGAPVSG